MLQFQLQNFLNDPWFGAIHDELHAFSKKRILDFLELSLQSEQALLPRRIGQIHDASNVLFCVGFGTEHYRGKQKAFQDYR